MPQVLDADDPDALDRIAAIVSDRGLVVAPVDGVYALIVDAFAAQATSLLRSLRGAAPDLPLTLLIRGRRQLPGVTSSVPEAADRLAAAFWPGALTLILPAAQTMAVDLGASRGTVAVRMPADERTLALIAAVGPLACSTAAPAGEGAPIEVHAAVEAFGGAVHAYLDAGELDGTRSTVVDCSRGGAEVRRRGALSADDVLDAAAGAAAWAAGTDAEEEADADADDADPDAGDAGPGDAGPGDTGDAEAHADAGAGSGDTDANSDADDRA